MTPRTLHTHARRILIGCLTALAASVAPASIAQATEYHHTSGTDITTRGVHQNVNVGEPPVDFGERVVDGGRLTQVTVDRKRFCVVLFRDLVRLRVTEPGDTVLQDRHRLGPG